MNRNRRSILWEMARLAVREDRLADAFRQFASVREDFLRRGMLMSAAFVALDMAELLVEIGRAEGARQWCRELVQTFSSAGMPYIRTDSDLREQLAASRAHVLLTFGMHDEAAVVRVQDRTRYRHLRPGTPC